MKILNEASSRHAIAKVIERWVVDALDGKIPDAVSPLVTARQIAPVYVPQTSLPFFDKTLPLIPGRTTTKCLNIVHVHVVVEAKLITQPDVWTFICGHQSASALLKLT